MENKRMRDMLDQYAPTLFKPREIDLDAEFEKKRRAARAAALLADDELKAAFAKVEDFYMQTWRTTDFLDVERREQSWIAVQLLTDVKNALLTVVREGELSERLIAQAREQK